MKIVFAGTPEFSVAALAALHAAGHEILGVFTQPDRPAGRGQKLQSSAVAQKAVALKLSLFKPLKFDAEAQTQLRALNPEAMVVVAYGLILPQAVLDIPRHGCFNIHASLLPRWRGAAPIQRAILAGDCTTGITIMRMDAGLDTGAMLLREAVPIGEDDNAAAVHGRLAVLGARLMVETLRQIENGTQKETAQPVEGASYAKKINKDEARLDWSRPATKLARAVRAFNPAPVAWTELDGERIRIYAAEALGTRLDVAPGVISMTNAGSIVVNCGEGSLMIKRLQRPGGRPLDIDEVLRGWNPDGRRFS
ncbi:MAG: methionyl-tRNA formyltransferase [Pseudomonadota bacterium]|mgnify:CR=1 FL=1